MLIHGDLRVSGVSASSPYIESTGAPYSKYSSYMEICGDLRAGAAISSRYTPLLHPLATSPCYTPCYTPLLHPLATSPCYTSCYTPCYIPLLHPLATPLRRELRDLLNPKVKEKQGEKLAKLRVRNAKQGTCAAA